MKEMQNPDTTGNTTRIEMNCPSCKQEGDFQIGRFHHFNLVDAALCTYEGTAHTEMESRTKVMIPNLPELFDYQKDAVEFALRRTRSMLVIPTGDGKTVTGLAVSNELSLPTLIIAPTLPLTQQWAKNIRSYGSFCTIFSSETNEDFSHLTITTYQSAILHLDKLKKYGLVVFDEVHHLFAPVYVKIVRQAMENGSIIVGLTATDLEDQDDRKSIQDEIFPEKYIRTLADKQHSDRKVDLKFIEIPITLSDGDLKEYKRLWEVYVSSIQKHGGFREMMAAARWHGPGTDNKGMLAYTKIKRLLSEQKSKFDKTIDIIKSNPSGTFIVFGEFITGLEVLYRRLLKEGVPTVKIHAQRPRNKSDKLEQSKKQRNSYLDDFREGKARVLLGAVAIEEGLDIPDVDNAIFLANVSGTAKKAKQRTGRVLRSRPGKVASIYVMYAEETIEERNTREIRELLEV